MWLNIPDDTIETALVAAESRETDAMALALAELMPHLTLSDVDPARDAAYRAAAERQYLGDEVQVDDDAVVSASDGGAYVMAWTWVSADEAAAPPDDEDDEDEDDEDDGASGQDRKTYSDTQDREHYALDEDDDDEEDAP